VSSSASSSADSAQTAAPALYAEKSDAYFDGAQKHILDLLPRAELAVMELGCGSGGTARAARAAGKVSRYVGIELNPAAAARAADVLDEVVVGNVEALDLTSFRNQFDVLIMSEVLEHLSDPWAALRAMLGCLRPGGTVYASSPNVAHWHVIRELLKGRFRYEESGVMDRTHLRWFTPESYRAMFEAAGVHVAEVRPIARRTAKARIVSALTGGKLEHLFIGQIFLIGEKVRA
jgi:SAM-dependent methyltransferase